MWFCSKTKHSFLPGTLEQPRIQPLQPNLIKMSFLPLTDKKPEGEITLV